MKTISKLLSKFFMLLLCILAVACSKDESSNPDDGGDNQLEKGPGIISTDEFQTDEGEIGIIISAREMARKGYKPVEAIFSIGSSSISNQTIAMDTLNNVAILSYRIEDLDDVLEDELKEGVPIEVIINDKNGNVLTSTSYPILSFTANPIVREIDDDSLEDLYASVTLNNEVLYMAQVVNENNQVIGAPVSQLWMSTGDSSAPIVTKRIDDENIVYPSSYTADFTTFYFEEITDEEDVFNISVRNGTDIYYLYTAISGAAIGQTNIQSVANLANNGGNTDPAGLENYKFKIEKYSPGLFTITSVWADKKLVLDGDFESDTSNDLRLIAKDETTDQKTAYFRLLNLNIDWIIQPLSSQFGKPILPPSSTKQTQVNSTLKNCSSGSLITKVGIADSESTTQESAWSETFSVATTDEGSTSLTLGYEAEVSWFGVKGKASVEATGSYTYTKTETQTNTVSEAITGSKSKTVSFEREVSVPSGVGIAVADIFQVYRKIEVPFVQRYIIEGTHQSTGEALTGQEILTQFAFNSFTGVVTNVQSTYVEITVRGLTTINNVVETSTETRDIPDACSS